MNKVLAVRELDIAEKRLAAKRIEAKQTTKELDQRWSELHEGQRALKKNFSKFNEVSFLFNSILYIPLYVFIHYVIVYERESR